MSGSRLEIALCVAVGITLSSTLLATPAAAQGGAPSGLGRTPSPRLLAVDGLPVSAAAADGVDVALGGTNEPAIAINPLDPFNIAMASLFTARVSTDGGATWTAETAAVTPGPYFPNGDPVLAFDSTGRLFWTYLGATFGFDLFVSELDPVTGDLIAGPFAVTSTADLGDFHDKQWLVADCNPDSPFVDRLYLTWTLFPEPLFAPTEVLTSYSDDHGVTWSTPLAVSDLAGTEGFVWAAHNAVAPNGDVYVSYHSQAVFNGIGDGGGNPDGLSGQTFVARSTDGGVSYPQKTVAFAPGDADVTFNVQNSPGAIPGATFWCQGSTQAWLLADPTTPGHVYCVAVDDPDDVHGSGDDADVFIARSTDDGLTWGAPILVDAGPAESFQLFPTAAIDKQSGCIVVVWYDNRAGAVNGSGNFLLDVYTSTSTDQGLTFSAPVAINDVPFDPDLGAPVRFPGPPPTTRIGEYIGTATAGGSLHAVWCGNTGGGQQTITDALVGGCPPWLDVGCAFPGVAGLPTLTGTGTLAALAQNSLRLDNAAPSAMALVFVSLASTPTPFKSGTLKTVPVITTAPGTTGVLGTIDIPFALPGGVPGGTVLYFQYAIADAVATQGVSLSNALRAVTP